MHIFDNKTSLMDSPEKSLNGGLMFHVCMRVLASLGGRIAGCSQWLGLRAHRWSRPVPPGSPE